MDQAGAVAGPLLIVVAVARSHGFAPAFLWLAVPAIGTLIALAFARVLHPSRGSSANAPGPQTLPNIFWIYVVSAGLLAFGFVDFPLLAFHFQDKAFFQESTIPLLYAGAMGVEGITAFIFGRLFDRYGLLVLAVGTAVSLLSLPLGFLGGAGAAVAGLGCWAAGMGAQDACLRSGISQVVSMNKRGNAFGVFNGVFGVMWFLGSLAMGFLYERSLLELVIFGIAAQTAAVAFFIWLRGPVAAAAR